MLTGVTTIALLAEFTTGRDLSPDQLDSAYRGPAAKVGGNIADGGLVTILLNKWFIVQPICS